MREVETLLRGAALFLFAVLQSVCREGGELVGSRVFRELGIFRGVGAAAVECSDLGFGLAEAGVFR